MTSYVLVHGAWHGGWCWRRVAKMLQAPGADIHTPTLTGLGERAHLLSRDVGLATHVDDVLGLLQFEDLNEVVLVGHSYGGMVATAVADRAPHRIARVVYLDAVVPRNGQSLFDCSGPDFRTYIEEQTNTLGEGWKIPPPPPGRLGLMRDADIAWAATRLVPHPFRTFVEPIALSAAPPVRTYVNCIGDKPRGGPRTPQAEGIDDYHELATGHDAMITLPAEVADILRKSG